jgi:hypothetical protein
MLHMRRQEFFGGAAAVWPGIGEAQQAAAMPRIGALMGPRARSEANLGSGLLRAGIWGQGRAVRKKGPREVDQPGP